MNKFAQEAKQALSGCKVMENREKITTEELIRTYPQGVTVNEFDLIASNDKTYAVFAFAEDPKKFFNGGTIATKIAERWANLYEGDIELASDELKASGGVKFIISSKKTRNGRTLTDFTPVE